MSVIAEPVLVSADTLKVGSVVVHRLADMENVSWPAAAIFRDLPPQLLREAARDHPSAVDPANDAIRLTFNSYIVRTPDFLCLIDAGIGNGKERPDRPLWHRYDGDFMPRMNALGYQAKDVDLVINTHLHADHVGWNTVKTDGAWRPAFPNARYVVAARELAYWQDLYRSDPHVLHGAYQDSVQPIVAEGLFDAVECPAEIAPGLTLEAAPGHTLGMATVRLRTDHGDVLFLADVLHSPIQLATPDLVSNFCVDPAQARATRHRLLDASAGTNTIVATYHFPPPVFGRIVRKDKGYAFQPVA